MNRKQHRHMFSSLLRVLTSLANRCLHIWITGCQHACSARCCAAAVPEHRGIKAEQWRHTVVITPQWPLGSPDAFVLLHVRMQLQHWFRRDLQSIDQWACDQLCHTQRVLFVLLYVLLQTLCSPQHSVTVRGLNPHPVQTLGGRCLCWCVWFSVSWTDISGRSFANLSCAATEKKFSPATLQKQP